MKAEDFEAMIFDAILKADVARIEIFGILIHPSHCVKRTSQRIEVDYGTTERRFYFSSYRLILSYDVPENACFIVHFIH